MPSPLSNPSDFRTQVDENGFVVVKGVVGCGLIEQLVCEAERLMEDSTKRRGGIRDVMGKSEIVKQTALDGVLSELAESFLSADARAVRSILFDKTPESNWHVAWHQDKTIAVKQKHDVEGYGPWSIKEKVPHVQPPVEVLERMVTLRLFLDVCDESNGPLKVIKGSHREGITNKSPQVKKENVMMITGHPGDVLVMKPLIWHSSNKATAIRHRRILHVEYSADELAGDLNWVE